MNLLHELWTTILSLFDEEAWLQLHHNHFNNRMYRNPRENKSFKNKTLLLLPAGQEVGVEGNPLEPHQGSEHTKVQAIFPLMDFWGPQTTNEVLWNTHTKFAQGRWISASQRQLTKKTGTEQLKKTYKVFENFCEEKNMHNYIEEASNIKTLTILLPVWCQHILEISYMSWRGQLQGTSNPRNIRVRQPFQCCFLSPYRWCFCMCVRPDQELIPALGSWSLTYWFQLPYNTGNKYLCHISTS